MPKHEEYGSSYKEAYAVQQQKLREAYQMIEAENYILALPVDVAQIRSIRMRLDSNGAAGCLAVVSATFDGEAQVGFHAGDGLLETFRGALNRLAGNRMKFKEDTPYGG